MSEECLFWGPVLYGVVFVIGFRAVTAIQSMQSDEREEDHGNDDGCCCLPTNPNDTVQDKTCSVKSEEKHTEDAAKQHEKTREMVNVVIEYDGTYVRGKDIEEIVKNLDGQVIRHYRASLSSCRMSVLASIPNFHTHHITHSPHVLSVFEPSQIDYSIDDH